MFFMFVLFSPDSDLIYEPLVCLLQQTMKIIMSQGWRIVSGQPISLHAYAMCAWSVNNMSTFSLTSAPA